MARKKPHTAIYIDNELYEKLKALAQAEGRSIKMQLEMILRGIVL